MSAAALEGDLAQFFATEILQFLRLAAATGRLELERPGERAELYVENGQPVFARTSGPALRVGEILLRRGAISRESLERCLEEQRHTPREPLGSLLVRTGATSREQVAQALNEVWKRIVFGVMLWRDGRFRFASGERVELGDVRLEFDLERFILEGLRQADEVRRAAAPHSG